VHVIFTLLMLFATGFGLWLVGKVITTFWKELGGSWHDDDPDDYDW
jgi:hypothetical protein